MSGGGCIVADRCRTARRWGWDGAQGVEWRATNVRRAVEGGLGIGGRVLYFKQVGPGRHTCEAAVVVSGAERGGVAAVQRRVTLLVTARGSAPTRARL